MTARGDRGFTMVEALVSLAVFSIAATGFAGLVVSGGKINKSQQMAITAQSDARNCVSLIEQALRSAGWDPRNAGIQTVVLQSPAEAADNWIEIFADLDEDTFTTGPGEDITIRLNGTTLEWKTSGSGSFAILAPNITNDANGDGVPELMFTPDSATYPKRITVTVTAQSPAPDPRTGQHIRATVSTDVLLRARL